jgi:beta-lactam-binding protein with PASTA domain/tRNA A-37 threonylcarbamoyl transferase component Bud32
MVGRLIDGRYQVRSRIARGGMATVYLATDLRLERRVAIKVMHDHLAEDSAFKERFIQEARSAARLAHPNVVNVFDQGQDSDTAYLVMEYLPGINLRDLLQEHGKLTTEQTLDVMEAILSGLSAAHKAGIVHRDLKPENVMLADDGRIKIGDFGLARAVSANTATGAALLGTIAYLSPELVTRGIADARSDIYAVGIMMYEMLTGEQPYKGEQPMQIAYQHANDSVPTPSSKNSRVPAELDELVLWATAREPDERPRDARVMLDQLVATQTVLASALPTGAGSAPVQRTMVLPTAMASDASSTTVLTPPSNDDTVVLRPKTKSVTGPVVAEGADELGARARKRRVRGWWIFVLVLLLAGAAGGTGWYFNAGPGAQITVSDVAGMTVADATTALQADGLVVSATTGQAPHPTIPVGDVVSTEPGTDTVLGKGDEVVLLLSTGPEALPVPELRGIPEDQANTTITDNRFTLSADDPIRQFDAAVPAGTVLDVLDAGGASIATGALYGDQQPLRLVVSAGALPDLTNKTVDDATSELEGLRLSATPGIENYSDTVDEGSVIGIDLASDADGVIREGEGVQLEISRGPQPVAVPDLEGETREDAMAALSELGFTVSYNPLFTPFPGSTVTGTSPAAGEEAPKGSNITLYLQLFG